MILTSVDPFKFFLKLQIMQNLFAFPSSDALWDSAACHLVNGNMFFKTMAKYSLYLNIEKEATISFPTFISLDFHR